MITIEDLERWEASKEQLDKFRLHIREGDTIENILQKLFSEEEDDLACWIYNKYTRDDLLYIAGKSDC